MKLTLLVFALAAMVSPAASDNNYAPAMELFLQKELVHWSQSDVLLDAVTLQNTRTASYDQATIDALDAQWRSEIGKADTPIISPVLNSDAAKYLRQKVETSGGQITEAFVMDARGLTVAASDITSDYWQGDEEKFTKTFEKGAFAYHFGTVELDRSTHMYQVQISLTLRDPTNGAAIGALTVGVVADTLK